MTAIDALLSHLEFEVEPFAICDVRAGWHLPLPDSHHVTMHYALAGSGSFVIGSDRLSIPFTRETILLCAPGLSQRIVVTHGGPMETTRCAPAAEGLAWLRAGDKGPRALLACGLIRASVGPTTSLFERLREPIVESFADEPIVQAAFRTLLQEVAEPGLGSRALIGSLMKQCVIMLLRRLAQRSDHRLPWLLALQDRRLASALDTMLDPTNTQKGLDTLAETAGMSRSAFTARFKAVFGLSPQRFLTERRLWRAAQLLETSGLPVKAVAANVGFQSRSYFSRAFKAQYGTDPDSFRRRSTGSTSHP